MFPNWEPALDEIPVNLYPGDTPETIVSVDSLKFAFNISPQIISKSVGDVAVLESANAK